MDKDQLELINKLLDNYEIMKCSLDQLPPYMIGVVDNPIHDAVCRNNDLLIQVALGKSLAEDVMYFVYDMPKSGGVVVVNKKTYKFKTREQFIKYLKTVYNEGS